MVALYTVHPRGLISKNETLYKKWRLKINIMNLQKWKACMLRLMNHPYNSEVKNMHLYKA